MLKHFGSATCPRCDSGLVQGYDVMGDFEAMGDMPHQDTRWMCPSCGYSRPVIYAVERDAIRRGHGIRHR